MGVYRAAFTSIEQTEPLAAGLLTGHKVKVPVVALGGEQGLGDKVLTMLKLVAKDATGKAIADCGHFLPEEHPEAVLRPRASLERANPQPMNIPNDHLAPSIP